MKRPFALVLLVLVAASLSASVWAADKPLKVLIFERAPYYVQELDGGFTGKVATPIAEAFEKAALPFKWKIMAANRHLKTIQKNREPVCAAGWFKNPEREAFGKYTEAVYQDAPQVALVRADNVTALKMKSVEALLSNKALTMGRKLGFSYGPYVDPLLKKYDLAAVTSSQDNVGMIRMLLGQRFDYMIVSAEEAEELIHMLGVAGNDIALLQLEDMPPGGKRYLICSKATDDDHIRRLNAALAKRR
ncbi:ABC transporter substrate-binding protein [Magnetospira sp. QH-2]|uniref:substrate-binding periplasmic protein n=1 Tax=Magnetospira sp. (strain QH-2) TaxID=1288970 RepID=UPI0003E81438|nr:transporter substrate-binding domain-containing protein [Magnetospira sp. QH-2]CCQ73602.1 Conserved periplasmic binding protein of unknown function [Magnetospira sp. QH-2]